MRLKTALPLLAAVMAIPLSACGGRVGDSMDFVVEETSEAGSDAIGLPRERPGPVMVDQGDETVPTPYGGLGSRRTCETSARDIARLTVVLGADREQPVQANETDEEAEARSIWHRGRRLVGEAPDAAVDVAHSTIVGLNPVRPVVRFVGRAGEIEREARRQREMALKRRAYLRGLYDGFGCDPSYLVEVFEEYGLVESDAIQSAGGSEAR